MMLRERCLPHVEYLEYIEGQPTHQYIDTQQAVNFENVKIECEWLLRRTDQTHKSYVHIFGNYIDENNPCTRLILATSESSYYSNCDWRAGNAKTLTSLALNTKHNIVMIPSTITVDNTDYSIPSTLSNSYTNNLTVKIFSTNTTTNQSITNHFLRIYLFRIWDGAVLLRDLAPCRYNGKIGLYDKVNKKFYGNSGVGNFTAGPKI